MQYGSSAHHARHQLRPVASEDYKVRESRFEQMPNRLLDPPPYSRFEQMPNRLLDPPPYSRFEQMPDRLLDPPPYSRFEQMPSTLFDPPPYADSYMKSYSFDEYRPETQHKVVVVDNRHPKYKANEEEEDVNTEADDFIKHAHKKFRQRQKSMSIFR